MPAEQAGQSNIISVKATEADLAQGYLKWLHEHPQARPGSGSKAAQAGQAGTPYKILWPTLDVYSPSGGLLYHGNDSARNVAVVNGLPRSLPRNASQGAQLRPTLADMKAMFPELPKTLPQARRYAVFVINFSKRPACKDQDLAIQRLKSRLSGSRVELLEVRID